MATAALHGWHPGELKIQRKLGFSEAVSNSWTYVRNSMPEQHRTFHTSNLPFIPLTTIDVDGRPWASIVASSTGNIGFVESPDPKTLSMRIRFWDGDPLMETAQTLADPGRRPSAAADRYLTAGLGIEFTTRRRNKFAGHIQRVRYLSGSEYQIDLKITETIGNCPKYINVRSLVPHPNTQPHVVHRHRHLAPAERLPEDVIQFILDADTAFIGTIYQSSASETKLYPPHAGMNARGGLPGFLRVRPSDGRTVVIPDYSGNRFVSSLGNIEASGLAGLTIVSFTTGDILYLTGTAENIVGPSALKIMARHASLTLVTVTGFVFVRNALPIRQRINTGVERSPYSPKIKYLVEEADSQIDGNEQRKAMLQEAVQLTPDLAVFRFKVISKCGVSDLKIRPGQAIVLDFMDWIGPPQYQHMANSAPGSINDDRVRTWTVSSAHEEQDASCFELTMREMKGGAVTGALFNLLRTNPHSRHGQRIMIDAHVRADIVGITGDFYLSPGTVDDLWVAGGIGLTPFLAMLQALSERRSKAEGDVTLVLSTREPDAMLELMRPSLVGMPIAVRVTIAIFTNAIFELDDLDWPNVDISLHRGRVDHDYWKDISNAKEVFICGPSDFGDVITNGLQAANVPQSRIHREGFY